MHNYVQNSWTTTVSIRRLSEDACSETLDLCLNSGNTTWSFSTILSRYFFTNEIKTSANDVQGIIQENDHYQNEMDELERELTGLRRFLEQKDVEHGSGKPWLDEIVMNRIGGDAPPRFNSVWCIWELFLIFYQVTTEIALVIIDGDSFRVHPSLSHF